MASERFSPLSTPSATREVLERHGLYTKYALGQNFLVNDDVIGKIIALADIMPTDRILEVGPGIGTLTAALLPRAAHVTAIEKDRDLAPVLADTLAPWSDKFALIQADALEISAASLMPLPAASNDSLKADQPHHPEQSAQREAEKLAALSESLQASQSHHSDRGAQREAEGRTASSESPQAFHPRHPERSAQRGVEGSPRSGQLAPAPNKLVSNLPYAVAATVVLDYLQRFDFLESATVMVQKEVADRMTARPATKAYGAYTVKLSLYAKPAGRFPVAPGNFFPPPHVESAVLRLDREIARDESGRELTPADMAAACEMADAAFATRRKTLSNSCKTYFASQPDTQAALPRIFETAGVDPRRRGETLTREEFIRLGKALRAHS